MRIRLLASAAALAGYSGDPPPICMYYRVSI